MTFYQYTQGFTEGMQLPHNSDSIDVGVAKKINSNSIRLAFRKCTEDFELTVAVTYYFAVEIVACPLFL